MNLFSLTLVTEIEVIAYTALVSNTLNWSRTTTVTGDTRMDNCCLISYFFAKIVNHESLEGLGGITSDLFSQDFHEVTEEFVVQ